MILAFHAAPVTGGQILYHGKAQIFLGFKRSISHSFIMGPSWGHEKKG